MPGSVGSHLERADAAAGLAGDGFQAYDCAGEGAAGGLFQDFSLDNAGVECAGQEE